MQQPPSARCLKVGEEIKRSLAAYFQKNQFYNPALEDLKLMITEVRMSPDLQFAKIYLLPMGGGDINTALTLLEAENMHIRKYVAKSVHLRQVPKLVFRNDDTFAEVKKINQLLQDPKITRDLSDADD